MPRFLAVGHVTWDRLGSHTVLGGSAAYAASCAQRLGWQAAILTSAGQDFIPEIHLPDVSVFRHVSHKTTRFINEYNEEGVRRQFMLSRADDIVLDPLADEWRDPDVLLLCPVAGEIQGAFARGFGAGTVGATGQGWVRRFDADGRVAYTHFPDPHITLDGVHALFFSQDELPDTERCVTVFLAITPILLITRGWEGLTLYTREATHVVPALPREEVDPTGAGDVFATAFLVGYHETGDLLQAAAFGVCAASCVVEGLGMSALGDRAEVERRVRLRERLVEEGEWED